MSRRGALPSPQSSPGGGGSQAGAGVVAGVVVGGPREGAWIPVSGHGNDGRGTVGMARELGYDGARMRLGTTRFHPTSADAIQRASDTGRIQMGARVRQESRRTLTVDADICEFLSREEFTFDSLKQLGVLQYWQADQYLLRAGSVVPLIDLMNEHGITRLVHGEWYFASNGDYCNPRLSRHNTPKVGNLADLASKGDVFDYQNRYINPYFGRHNNEDGEASSTNDSTEEFSLERDLQRALRANIEQLEPGLRIIDGGTERTVEGGRIDILAEDDESNVVVIELKARRAPNDSLTQLQSYMGSREFQGKPTRGILVARGFPQRLVTANRLSSNISLKAYSFQFTFEDR